MIRIEHDGKDFFLDGELIDKEEYAITQQKKINDYLGRWNLRVRPLKLGDLPKLEEKDENDLDHIDKICGKDDGVLSDMLKQYFDQIREQEENFFDESESVKQEYIDDIVPIVIVKENRKEWKEEIKDWVQKDEWEEKIYCFLAEHFHEDEILSFSVTYMNKNNIKNGLYFESSCTLQSHHCSKSLNYFIRVYAILEMIKNNEPIKFIWGCMAGSDQNKLKNIHINRGCNISENEYCKRNPEFQCNISSFLNVFFSKMESYNWPNCK